MIKSSLANLFVIAILGLTAGFGYYRAFLSLITRTVKLSETRELQGSLVLLIGFVFLVGAIVASGIAIIFYFSL